MIKRNSINSLLCHSSPKIKPIILTTLTHKNNKTNPTTKTQPIPKKSHPFNQPWPKNQKVNNNNNLHQILMKHLKIQSKQ
jgi:hypothetical protein